MKRSAGFTLIEVLMTIALFGVLAVVLSTTLSRSFQLTGQAQGQLNATTQIQQIVETVRQSWQKQTNYDAACTPGQVWPQGYEVTFINLDGRAEPVGVDGTSGASAAGTPVETSNPCHVDPVTDSLPPPVSGGLAEAPPIRRLRVSTVEQGGETGVQNITVTVDILRP